MTRLVGMSYSDIPVNTHFDQLHGQRTIGWDVDVSLDKLRVIERVLKVRVDLSTSCPEVHTYPELQRRCPN